MQSPPLPCTTLHKGSEDELQFKNLAFHVLLFWVINRKKDKVTGTICFQEKTVTMLKRWAKTIEKRKKRETNHQGKSYETPNEFQIQPKSFQPTVVLLHVIRNARSLEYQQYMEGGITVTNPEIARTTRCSLGDWHLLRVIDFRPSTHTVLIESSWLVPTPRRTVTPPPPSGFMNPK